MQLNNRNFAMRSLSEQDILDLQNAFLTFGYHRVPVSSLGWGRTLICSFLSSLSCFSSVSCLTYSRGILPNGVVSLHEELALATDFSSDSIDHFLLENFYYDFCWIECTPELVDSAWFKHFRQRLDDFNFVGSMSVVELCLA